MWSLDGSHRQAGRTSVRCVDTAERYVRSDTARQLVTVATPSSDHRLTGGPDGAQENLERSRGLGLLVRFAAFTGLRAGEIGALRVGRMDPDGRWVEVAESAEEVHGELLYGPPKTYSRRRVEILEGLAPELRAHLLTRPSDVGAFVFTAPDDGALRHSNFYRRHYKPAVVRAGLDPRTRFHDLRHTAAAMMIGQGAHLLVIKERLWDSSISVTADRYGHLYPSLSAALTTQLGDVYCASATAEADRQKP